MPAVNYSIHPRVVNKRTAYPKRNTCKAQKPATKQRTIHAIAAHLKRYPNDYMSLKRVDKLSKE